MGGVQLILFWHLHDFWEEFFPFCCCNFWMTSVRGREIKWADIYEGQRLEIFGSHSNRMCFFFFINFYLFKIVKKKWKNSFQFLYFLRRVLASATCLTAVINLYILKAFFFFYQASDITFLNLNFALKRKFFKLCVVSSLNRKLFIYFFIFFFFTWVTHKK